MEPSQYPILGTFTNDTKSPVSIHLEMVPEEVVLSPGHSIDLLARPSVNLLPLTINVVEGGIQVHANREFDPDWHIQFLGKLIKPGTPTKLSDYK
jgi:hypothetical protein